MADKGKRPSGVSRRAFLRRRQNGASPAIEKGYPCRPCLNCRFASERCLGIAVAPIMWRGFREIYVEHRAIAKRFHSRPNQPLEPEGPFLFSASTRELSRASAHFGFCASA